MAVDLRLDCAASRGDGGRRFRVSWNLSTRREDENLDRTPIRIQVRARLLAHSQRLELAIVKSEVLDQILAYHHGPGLGEDQILLGVAIHAGGNHNDRNSELMSVPGIRRRL